MKNSIRNKIAYFVLYTLMLAVCFLFSSCFGPFQAGDGGSDEGNITINLGGSPSLNVVSRSVLWPTEDPTVLDEIKYEILLTGPGGTISLTASGRDTISVKNVIVGKWNVSIKAYYKSATFLYATGENSVDVKGGQTNAVGITMKKAYYSIGGTGPGGGIVFYVDPVGFTMADTGLTAHYLEAAPGGWDGGGSDPNLAWASYPSSSYNGVSGTGTDIGTGRKNTALMLASGDVPAAQACKGYENNGKTDWFIPSIDELDKLYENREYVDGLSTATGSRYFSSSQPISNLASAESIDFADGTKVNWGKDYGALVRAIRAF
jgi:hypothetical protein